MNRRQLIRHLATLALCERFSFASRAWAAGQALPPPGVHEFSGEVTINGQPARPRMTISAGDRIVTGNNAQAIYIIGSDAYLQRADSAVQVIEDNATRRVLRILQGRLMGVFGKGEKSLQTPTATIGIRGTACYIEASAAQVYFCLCYGEAEIRAPGETAILETIATTYHDHPLYLNADRQRMMVPARVINHTDAELILLESLVGRIPPFVGLGYHRY